MLSFSKLFLNLLVIVCLGVAIWDGYILFTHQTSPVLGTVIFLVAIGALVWNVSVLRSHKWRGINPKFKWVFLSLLGVFLVLAFAGVHPLEVYKDNAVSVVGGGVDKITSLVSNAAQDDTGNSKENAPKITGLHGTYTATVSTMGLSGSTAGVKRTAKFSGDTMTVYDEVYGKSVLKYFIPGGLSSGQVIHYTNIATGEKFDARFKYVAEYDCFTIGEGYNSVTYYR